jgi:dipeptidyl aminopeptidase/acylaminoacyl peptidase
VEWSLADGSRISAWVHDDPGASPGRPAVLFLHGNGENLETMRHAGRFE